MARKPLVALVGRPNVGKSTLFNRLIGERLAVTDDIPGTTRDRLVGEFEWRGIVFHVVDTGGIEVYQPKGSRDVSPLAEGSAEFVTEIQAQAMMAIEGADVIILLVDSIPGLTAADEEVAEILRRTKKPVIVAVNKTDHISRENEAVEFYALGVGDVVPISAIHGGGVGDLLDAVVDSLGDEESLASLESEEDDDDHMKIAIIGRPNVGKSSLLNRLLGEDRVIVSPVAGTTRDAIDIDIKFHGEPVTLIDTAGMRKRGKIEPGVEKFSVLRALKAMERADIVLLMLDATTGITEQDLHIGGFVQEAFRSVIIVVNKWDAVDKSSGTMVEFERLVRDRFDFLSYAPIIFISALTGQRIHTVLDTAQQVWEARHFRIPTGELNELIRRAYQEHTPPIRGTRRLKILYVSQVRIDPPLILFHVNDPKLVHFTYRRYLENRIRAEYPFSGTPIRMSFRSRDGMKEKD